MKKQILDCKAIDEDLLNALYEKFPDGYSKKDILSIKTDSGDFVECIQIKLNGVKFFIKASSELLNTIEKYVNEDDYDYIE